MKYFKWSIIFFVFIFIGCAHQSRITSSPAPVIESSANQNKEANPHASNSEKDFLEDDFKGGSKADKEIKENIPDPIAPWNRVMFQFNDKLYFWVLKPVQKNTRQLLRSR